MRGQDWPSEEVELLKALYDIRQICVADGVQQLVRGRQANWFAGMKNEDRDLIHLDKSLRMRVKSLEFYQSLF